MDSPTSWTSEILRHARDTGAPDLPPAAIEELSAHLDDLYLAARRAGLDHPAARARALAALAESRLADLVARPHRRFREPAPPPGPPFGRSWPFRSTSMLHALRLAVGQFSHHRSLTFVIVLVLGLGVGAGVTVFTVVDAVVLRPLPYRAPAELVALWDANAEKGLPHEPMSPVTFMDYRTLDSFTDAAGWWRPDVNLVDPGSDPVRVRAIETGANLFEVLGVAPQVGPGFPAGGPLFSPDLIAVISDRLWRARYQADPGLVGRQLQLNGTGYTIVGVMPPGFEFPGDIDVWERSRWDFRQHTRAAHFMEGVARLAPGVGLARASEQATQLTARLGKEFPNSNRGWNLRLVPLVEDQLGYYRPALLVLFGAVGLLVVIGCLNVASLILTRALSREREMAVRTALGASPRHLIVQLLAESLVLSLAGALVGVVAAVLALPLIVSTTPLDVPRLAEVGVNGRVIGFAVGLATAMTIAFGLVPALILARRSLTGGLRSGERGSSRTSHAIYRVLVIGEMALACALLVSSGLLVRTVGRMTNVPIGVGSPEVVTASVQLSTSGKPRLTADDWLPVAATYGGVLDLVRQQSVVRAAGAANFLPLDAGWRVPFIIEGQPPVAATDLPQAQYHSVSEGYFEAIGAARSGGRFFTPQDGVTSAGVVVVNRTLARRYFPGDQAVGRILLTNNRAIGPLGRNLMAASVPQAAATGAAQQASAPPLPPSRFEIVGVVDDVRNTPLGQPIEPAIYFSMRQYPFSAMFLAVEGPSVTAAVAAVRSALRQAAPGVPLADVRTWSERARARTAEPRLLMTILVFFGALAASLAALGVYGLFSWTVALRRRELAIRLTLGARPARVGGLILRQAGILIGLGLIIGWIVVRAGDQLLARVLFELSPSDPRSTVAAGLLLIAASLAAALPAAWRAMRVDPVEGLKTE